MRRTDWTTVAAVDHQRALVRLPYVKSRPIRVGTVLDKDGDLYRVKWDDGAEEEVHLGDYEKVTDRGSLTFQSLVDPDGLRAEFDQEPSAVVFRALQESAKPMTGKDLKETLTRLGIEDKSYRGAWTSIRKVLMNDARVTVDGTGAGTTFAAEDAEPSAPHVVVPTTWTPMARATPVAEAAAPAEAAEPAEDADAVSPAEDTEAAEDNEAAEPVSAAQAEEPASDEATPAKPVEDGQTA